MLEYKLEIVPLPEGIITEKDTFIEMRDGIKLCVNIYRPEKTGKFPVIISFSAYGKEDRWQDRDERLKVSFAKGVSVGKIHVSLPTPWEAPDPAFWVPNDYVVIHVDVRGFGKSGGEREGSLRRWSKSETRDYYDVIEWAGKQEWSNGNVGLSGVSYLAMSQYYAASTRPPHLKAICPWEGVSNQYRDWAFPGGIPETTFSPGWETRTLGRVFNETSLAEFLDPVANQSMLETVPELEKIEVPALICATWSDQGLHSRGSFQAFMKISSKSKWLYTHGRRKWEEYYSDEVTLPRN